MKQVDATAQAQCFSDINGGSCDAVAAGTLGDSCAQVCVAAPAGVGGTSGGGGSGGSGGTSGGGLITDPIVFCRMSTDAICDRAFQCVPVASRDANFTDSYGASATACKAMAEPTCVDPTTNCPTYNAANGGSCVAALTNDACADLVFGDGIFPPASCFTACGM